MRTIRRQAVASIAKLPPAFYYCNCDIWICLWAYAIGGVLGRMLTIHLLPFKLQTTMRSRLLDNMGMLKLDQCKYAEALQYKRQVLEIHKELSRNNEMLAYDYQMLSYIYGKMNDKKQTILYIDSAFLCAGDNAELQLAISDLSIPSYMSIGMYEQALMLVQKFDSVAIKEYGQHSKKRISFLLFAGNIYNAMGERKKCAEKYVECEKLTLEVCGAESDEHITALNGLANSLALAGQIDAGASKYVELERMLSRITKERMGSMSHQERETYWNKTADTMQSMTSYGLAGHVTSEDFIEAACNALIFSKSLLLESEISSRELLEQKGTKENKALLNRIIKNRILLDSLRDDYDKNIDEITRLKLQISKDDYLLSAQFKNYSECNDFLNITVDDVRKAMLENSILIDYTDIKTNSKHFHAAFVTVKATNKTTMQLVFDWKKVEKLLDGAPIDVLYKDYMNDEARSMIWDSLSRYANEGCTIYYVPAGMMHQISLESFTAPDGKLLGEHYNFVRLSSARELVKKRTTVKPKKAVLYGGLKYEMSADSMLAESRKYKHCDLIAETRSDERGDSAFRELPHTSEEVNDVAVLLKKTGIKVIPLLGTEGSEESFLSMSGNAPEILHIATHGFYYTSEVAMRVSYIKDYDNAMMRSGLIMSGANAISRNETVAGVCDGLLRAGDIAKLNLKGTDMVVLSACQTGLGKVTAEGVFGLQRGFKLAGATTIVMTLWNVDDRATKEFMVKFYERLIADKWNKRKAFNETRSFMRDKYKESPYYWAGFIMLD